MKLYPHKLLKTKCPVLIKINVENHRLNHVDINLNTMLHEEFLDGARVKRVPRAAHCELVVHVLGLQLRTHLLTSH